MTSVDQRLKPSPPRKKSPRAPSIDLPEALARADAVYNKERRHPAPADAVAQALGYKNANNGAALSALASLRYYGLLERPQPGFFAVTKDFEDFRFAPNDQLRLEFLNGWLKAPPMFADLLSKYEAGLPSNATLRFDLIQRGFAPAAADSALGAFKRSVEYVEQVSGQLPQPPFHDENHASLPSSLPRSLEPEGGACTPSPQDRASESMELTRGDPTDRIPVRLHGNRRAWLEIPSPFFSADKRRLKAQIDLLLTDDEEEASAQ